MQTLTSAPALTSAHAKENHRDIQDKIATANVVPSVFRNVAVSVLLLAFAVSGFAQRPQGSPANVAAEDGPDDAAAGTAPAIEKSAGATINSAPGQPQSAAGLSKEIANPLSNLWLLQVQQNNTFMHVPFSDGTYVQSNMQFQPLIPIPVSPHWSLISRPVIEVFGSQPYPVVTSLNAGTRTPNAQIKRTTAFGDMVFATALSPDSSLVGNWLVAAGATFVFPTATQDALGQHTWQAGPAVALGYKGSKWLAFVFPQQWWKIGGDGRKTNQTLVQYNFSWNFDNGWSLGTSPNMTVNWEAPHDQQLSFPVGLQVGKLLHAGPMPVKVDMQVMYYAVRPTHTYAAVVPSPKWGFQLQFTPVMPPLIHGFRQ